MAVGIPATTAVRTGSLGNQNPIQMMQGITNLQNTLLQRQANLQAGDIISQSPDLDTAIQNMRQAGPLSGYMLQQMNQIRQQQLTQAETSRMGAEAYRTRYETGAEALQNSLLFGPNDINGSKAALATAENSLDPEVQKEVGGLFRDINESLYGGLDTAADPQGTFQQRRIALLMAAHMPAREAFATQNEIPPQAMTLGGEYDPTGLGIPRVVIAGGGASPLALPPGGVTGGAIGGPTGGTPGAAFGQGAGGPPPVLAAPGAAQAAGIQPAPGGPTVLAAGAPAGEQARATEIAADNLSATRDAPRQIMQMDLMDEALQKFQAGGWTPERMYAAKDLQGLKNSMDALGLPFVSQTYIDKLAGGSISGAQVFDALKQQFATAQLREAVSGTGAGRIREEVTAFLRSIDASTDPNALMTMINQSKYNMTVDLNRAEMWREFRGQLATHPGAMYPSDFYDWYSKTPEFAAINKSFGGQGINFSPYSSVPVLGTTEHERAAQTATPNYEAMPQGTRRWQTKNGVRRLWEKGPGNHWTVVPPGER